MRKAQFICAGRYCKYCMRVPMRPRKCISIKRRNGRWLTALPMKCGNNNSILSGPSVLRFQNTRLLLIQAQQSLFSPGPVMVIVRHRKIIFKSVANLIYNNVEYLLYLMYGEGIYHCLSVIE